MTETNDEVTQLKSYINSLKQRDDAARELLRLLLPERGSGCLCLECLRDEIREAKERAKGGGV